MIKPYQSLLVGFLNGTLTAFTSFITSYVIGVFVLGKYVVGNPFWGALIHFQWISVILSIAVPILLYRVYRTKLSKFSQQKKFTLALNSGVNFLIISVLLVKIYLLFEPTDFGLLISYSVSFLSNFIAAILVTLMTFFLLNRLSKADNTL
jgi:hypothetical protein